MATLYQCDRCKATQKSTLNTLSYPSMNSKYAHIDEGYSTIELCDKCMSKVARLIEDQALEPMFDARAAE